jgi:xylan 1,4-beta-xylosidase
LENLKLIDESIKVGSPCIPLLSENDLLFANRFFENVKTEQCLPDYLDVQFEDLPYENMKLVKDNGNTIKEDEKTTEWIFRNFICNAKKVKKDYLNREVPIYLTKWNITFSRDDLINDSCFRSCYLMKNLLENYDRLDGFGVMELSDLNDVFHMNEGVFHGGCGMFTNNSIPKSTYNSFLMLARMDGEMVTKGDGFFITRQAGKIAMLIYNYKHYLEMSHTFDLMSDIGRNQLKNENQVAFNVEFVGLKGESCIVKEFYINRNHGSSFETWLNMGKPTLTDEDALTALMSKCNTPGLIIHQEAIVDGRVKLHFRTIECEIRLIEIYKSSFS